MSFSLAVADGDLAIQGSQLKICWGIDKLKQDLSLWLKERYGLDRFHPTMGSILEEYIGGVIYEGVNAEIQSEVLRVLQNYQAVQERNIQESPSKYSLSELLFSIDDVRTQVQYDLVKVSLQVSTANNVSASITTLNSV